MKISRRTALKLSLVTAFSLTRKHSIFAMVASAKPSDVLAPGASLKAGQWVMVIDLKKCLAAKDCHDACVHACHETHNVPDLGNKKDAVKWIWREEGGHLFPDQLGEYHGAEMARQTIPALCNHCANAPCTRVCPTGATFKRRDGIVVMDPHRCIGCRFCMAACPYGSRSFNWKDPRPFLKKTNPDYPTRTKGVVEKCTFCDERLAQGKLPACVTTCPAGAMAFGDLKDGKSSVVKLLRENYSIRRKPELGTEPAVYYLV
jgi:molybdopterin-containing oxidoreductase family iron-sulfur binding subunit